MKRSVIILIIAFVIVGSFSFYFYRNYEKTVIVVEEETVSLTIQDIGSVLEINPNVDFLVSNSQQKNKLIQMGIPLDKIVFEETANSIKVI